jgi:hypothetical protein
MSHRHPRHPLSTPPILASPFPMILPPLIVVKPDKCIICIHPNIPKSIYCPRCQTIVTSTDHEKLPRRLAAVQAYNQPLDAFLDAFFGVVLNLDDPGHPLYRNFVEIFPGKPNNQLMTSSMGAMIKSDLLYDELLTVVPPLWDHHLKGTIFPRDIIPFAAYNREIPVKPRKMAPITPHFKSTGYTCEVCIRPRDAGAHYCPRCRRLITASHRFSYTEKKAGLKRNYTQDLDGFLCALTGVLLDENNPHDPYFLVYDHIIPGKKELAPAAFWVNDSKGWLSADQYWKVIGEYANHIRTKEPFDPNIITPKEWKQAIIRFKSLGRRIA